MKILITVFFVFISIIYTQGQEISTEKDIIGKYYYQLNIAPKAKYILKLKKNGTYIEILKKSRLGIVKRYGVWKIVGDSINVTINRELLDGIDNTKIVYPNFSFKIEFNGLCRTFVYCSSHRGCEKVETCYKKLGKRNDKFPSQTYIKILNPGYEGPWRNEKKE
jgi:hypothetical protein